MSLKRKARTVATALIVGGVSAHRHTGRERGHSGVWPKLPVGVQQ